MEETISSSSILESDVPKVRSDDSLHFLVDSRELSGFPDYKRRPAAR